MQRLLILFALIIFFIAGCGTIPPVRDTAAPVITVALSQTHVEPGHVIRMTAQAVAPGTTLTARGLEQIIRLVSVPESPGQSEGFLAIPLDTPPGPAAVEMRAIGEGQDQTWTESIEVKPRAPFATHYLKIKNFSTLPYGSESRWMARVRQEAGTYSGPRVNTWEWPVKGRLSERFGVKRIYNNGEGSWYHGGYDIAAPGGTPILAPAEGRVILAEPFKAHGNTVLLDHGYGVITSYLHQREIYVKTGDVVQRGQAIGEVGTTGGSTGDHLHFQVNVNGLIVDPADFLYLGQIAK